MSRFSRKVIALLMAVTMILTSMASVAFADNSSKYEESANILKGYGVLVGDNGNLMLDQQLKRQDAVIISLRLMGIPDNEFENYDVASNFTDITDEYYRPIIGMAQDLGLVEGMSDGTFGFNQNITAQQLETILLRALGYEISDDIYNQVPQMAQDLGLAKDVSVEAGQMITRDIVAQMMLNTLNTTVKDGNVKLGEQLGYMENEQPSALEVTGATVATDSTVKVTFNRAVADTSKLSFELKGTTSVETTVAWNNAKTEATLTAPSTLLEGAYTVKVSGDNFAAGKDSASLTVIKNGVAKIEFLDSNLIKDASHASNYKATLRYRVLDNYGTDITSTTTESDLTVASSRALNAGNPFDIDAEKGIMTLNFTAAFADTDKVVSVTIISTKTGKSANAVLNIADAAKVSDVTLNAVELPETTPATTRVLVNQGTAAYITMSAKDQYGNAVVDATALKEDGTGDVYFVKSDSNLVLTTEEYTDKSDNKAIRLIVDTTGITTAKNVTVTAISKSTGHSSTISLDVKEAAKADKIVVGNQAKLFAAGDEAGTFVLPITVTDQYGTRLTPDEIVQNVDNGNITINSDSNTNFAVQIARTGENKGKIVNADASATQGTHIVTVSTTTGSVATYTVDVKEAAYAKTIRINNAPATNLLMDAITKMDYKFFDQYGREMKNPGSANVTIEVSNADILTVAADSQTTTTLDKVIETTASAAAAEKSVTISTTGTADGSAKVTAKLFKDGSAISVVEKTLSVVKGVPSNLTFEISDIATLPSQAADGAIDGSDAYARAIIITAKDANGVTYAIPNSRIMSVTTQDNDLIRLSSDVVTGATVNAQEGYYVVAAQDEATAFPSVNDPATKTATIKVVVSTNDGPKDITKTVTIAKEDPKTVSIVFADKDLAAGEPYGLATDAKVISDISGTVSEIAAANLFVFEVDQYGVYTKVAAPTFKVVNSDRFNGSLTYTGTNSPATADDNTLNLTASQIKANENVYVMYQAANGVYGTFMVKASDGTMN